MTDYDLAIKIIIEFKKNFDKIDPKVPKKLLSLLGEYYVLRELKKRNIKVEHKGGQSGYDIYLPVLNKKIEVRTSLLKNEGLYPEHIAFYGWRVTEINQREDKFDFLIGVALDLSYEYVRFFIFTQKEALSVGDVAIKRYPKIKKKIHIFDTLEELEEAKEEEPEIVTDYEVYINKNPKKFLNRWDKIK